MKTIPRMLISELVGLVVFGLMLLLPACTFDNSQAWVFLPVVFALSMWIPSIYEMRKNPAALQRRLRAGPVAETERCRRPFIRSNYIPTGGE